MTAAGSGVGAAAIALARFAGARVFTTASTEAKRRRALESGAEAALDYTRPGWADELRALTGGEGVDLVVDHVGRAVFADASARSPTGAGSSSAAPRRARRSSST